MKNKSLTSKRNAFLVLLTLTISFIQIGCGKKAPESKNDTNNNPPTVETFKIDDNSARLVDEEFLNKNGCSFNQTAPFDFDMTCSDMPDAKSKHAQFIALNYYLANADKAVSLIPKKSYTKEILNLKIMNSMTYLFKMTFLPVGKNMLIVYEKITTEIQLEDQMYLFLNYLAGTKKIDFQFPNENEPLEKTVLVHLQSEVPSGIYQNTTFELIVDQFEFLNNLIAESPELKNTETWKKAQFVKEKLKEIIQRDNSNKPGVKS